MSDGFAMFQGIGSRWRRNTTRVMPRIFCFQVPVSVEVSLGAKLAQLRGECWHAHGLDTAAPLHMCFPLSQTCCVHSITLPTHSRWLKVATKQTSIWHGSGALISAIAKWSHLEALELRGSSSSRITWQQAGMATTADLMTLQQQIRQELAELQRVRENAHGNQWQTGCNQQHLQCHTDALSRSCRNSQAVQDQRS